MAKNKNDRRKKSLMIVYIIEAVYRFLWGDLFTLRLGTFSMGVPLLVLLLIPTGIYFTFRTNFVSVRLFPDMVRSLTEKKGNNNSLSPLQTLFVSTATRVGMGNLVGVVAAVSAGGAGAVFWMWLSAILGSATAFIEATLAQIHKEEDSLYGGFHGGPAYYIHYYAEKVRKKKLKHSVIAVLFALSGLLCWCGISQVISNSVASAFENAFSIPPIITTVILVILSAVIVLRKNATVKALDIIVPVMAAMYFIITIFIIMTHIWQLPGVFSRIFKEAFGLRAVAGGGFGAVLMNGVKRGLFSNEAGSGSAPCAAAAADEKEPVKMGLIQALGVFIDTIVICSCTAFILLLVPEELTRGLMGMELLQTAMNYHLGSFGVIFVAVILALFSFSTFLGILFYDKGYAVKRRSARFFPLTARQKDNPDCRWQLGCTHHQQHADSQSDNHQGKHGRAVYLANGQILLPASNRSRKSGRSTSEFICNGFHQRYGSRLCSSRSGYLPCGSRFHF